MKSLIRQVDIDQKSRNVVLVDKSLGDIQVSDRAVMAIDGSTTNTGIAILRALDGKLYFTCSFARESQESPVQYKVRLKKAVNDILLRNTLIESVYYEEPFIGYATAAANLLMLRTFIEELVEENRPVLDYLSYSEINNKKWKKLFLAPDKCPTGTELEKKAVRKKLESYMPFLSIVSQDEIDAISMGFVATVHIKNGNEEDLKSKKKVKPFTYKVKFMGTDYDEEEFGDFVDLFLESGGPESILDNGIKLTFCKPNEDFDKHVYKHMGNYDKLLIVQYDGDKHGDLALKYNIGALTCYKYIYAIVWRVNRKR